MPKPKGNKQTKQQTQNRQGSRALVIREPARVINPYSSRNPGKRQCERDFILASLDPVNYTGDFPCAVGYETNQTFRVCKKARAQVVVGDAGVGFIGINPYLAGAYDIDFGWHSTTGYTSPDANSTVHGVTPFAGSGAFASTAQMVVAETFSTSISYRVVAAGLRLTPTSPVLNISGAVYAWQNAQSDAFIGATSVTQATIVSDFNRPVTVLNGDQRQMYYTWTAPALHCGDWVAPATYAAAAAGMTDILLIAGATPGTTFLAEVVVYGEYKSSQFSTQATPSHSNKSVASEVSAYIAKLPVRVASQAGKSLGDKIASGAADVLSSLGSHAIDLFIGSMGRRIGLSAPPRPQLLAIQGPRSRQQTIEEID